MSRCVRFWQPLRELTPPRAVRADLGRFRRSLRGPYRAPAEAQRSGFGGKRRSSEMSEFSPICGGNEGYGAGDDVKRDKEQASSVALCSVTSARSAGSYGSFRGVPKWGQNRRGNITSAVVFPDSLLPQEKSRSHAQEKMLSWAKRHLPLCRTPERKMSFFADEHTQKLRRKTKNKPRLSSKPN